MDPILHQGLIKDWVILITSFIFMGWFLYMFVGLIRRRQQASMQKHLLDKFASAQDFAQFIQSPAGQKYVMTFTDAVTSPRNAILSSVRTGFVVMFLGIGLLLASDGYGVFFQAGWVALLLGIGFLVSAVVAYFLTKKANWKEQE